MDILRRKFEEHSDVILRELDVSKDLLARMTKAGLVDIGDCVRIQNLSTTRARNHAVISGLLDRRTDQAYPLLLECLRQSGQSKVADLLTDISTEVLLLSSLQEKLAEEIGRMEGFLRSEETRASISRKGQAAAEGNDVPNGSHAHSTPTTDREVWTTIQDSMRKAMNQFERCKAVIGKLHSDCEEVAKTNGDIVAKARECDRRMREILQQERGMKMAATVPTTTGQVFESLVADAEAMLKIKSRTMTKESEGRTQSMRLLRTIRDWVDERCTILNTFHSRMSPTGNPRFPGTSRSTLNNSVDSEVTGVEVHAISTVLEGMQLLEQKMREYIHLEILLTDKFRSELRLKQAVRKSRGFSPGGLKDIQEVVANVEEGDNVVENVQKLRRALDALAGEYDDCTRFMDRLTANMPFPVPKTKEDHLDEQDEERRAKEKKKERFGSILSLFRKSPTPSSNKGLASQDTLWSGSDQTPKLPRLALPNSAHQKGQGQGSEGKQSINRKTLLGKLQVLAENYRVLQQRQQRMTLRYTREVAKRKREAEDSVRRKDDQIVQLQIRVRELEAEKDKYKRLYEQTKVSYGRGAGER